MRRPGPLATLLLLATVALAPLLLSPMVYDDGHAVAHNPAIQSLGNVPAFFVDPGLFSSLGGRMYRPATLVSYAIEYALGGGATWVFKLGNLALHALAATLLFRLLRDVAGTAAALCGAGLFALHPLQTEAVAMISARSEILMAIGVILAAHAWWRAGHASAPEPGGEPGSGPGGVPARGPLGDRLLASGALLLALLSKEPALAALPLLVVLDLGAWRPGAGGGWRCVHWRALTMPLLIVVVWLVVRRTVLGTATAYLPAFRAGGSALGGDTRDLATQIALQAQFLPRALGLLAWPIGLCLDHALPATCALTSPQVLGGALLVLAVLVPLFLAPRRRPLLFAGGCLIVGFAAPWVALPLNVPFAEHRLYLPMAGVALVAAHFALRVRVPTPALAAAGVALAVLTCVRCLDWRSDAAIWSNTLERNPQSFRAQNALAHIDWRAGDLDRARERFEAALAIHPRYHDAYEGLSALLMELGEARASLTILDRAVAMTEDFARRRPGIAIVQLRAGLARLMRARLLARSAPERAAEDFARCEAQMRRCQEMASPKATVWSFLAEARFGLGERDEAFALLDEAERRGLPAAPIRFTRARLWAQSGRGAEAEREFLALLAIDPFVSEVHRELATLYEARGDRARAAHHRELTDAGAQPPASQLPGAAPNR